MTALAGTTCIELALEGERLCKAGDPKNGVRFFEEARKVGTSDSHTLSAIYSQLGNAYFALGDYQKALECHKMDVQITQTANDEVAEAKACGNLGNVYKMFGKFDEAAVYCRRYLNICLKLGDREGQARALYNLANVYHTQGKRLISSCDQEFSELSRDIKSSLERAVEFYEQTLKVVTELADVSTMGKSYGNLGNTHYLLGNFSLAVEYHKKRLELAQSINDKLGERRALLNLGNANVFVGDFQSAIENYSATLKLAQEFGDKNTEAHACYSLANSYTFLRDYKSAVKYHLKYLQLIRDAEDKLGEGRAYWSLVNLYLMLHDPENALVYARKHHHIAEQLNDKAGLASAKLNIQELEDVLAQRQAIPSGHHSGLQMNDQIIKQEKDMNDNENIQTKDNKTHETNKQISTQPKTLNLNNFENLHLTLDKRQEQEQRRFKKQLNINLTGEEISNSRRKTRQQLQETHHNHHRHHREHPRGGPVKSSSSERLFDMIAHFQSGRIDDQRCEITKTSHVSNKQPANLSKMKDEKDELRSIVVPAQFRDTPPSAQNQARARQSKLVKQSQTFDNSSGPEIRDDTNFLDNLMKYQSTRFEDQRSEFPKREANRPLNIKRRESEKREISIPDNFFNLIVRFQSDRLEDQRSAPPPKINNNS